MGKTQTSIDFSGQVALITGAAGGIGLACVNLFANAGANVVAVDMQASVLTDAVNDLGAVRKNVHPIEADVTQAADWHRVIDFATEKFSGVDILVNNAGIVESGMRIEEFDEQLFDRVMAVNVKGSFLGMKLVIPAMKRRGGGSIINVSSISGHKGNALVSSYTASKHAVLGITKCGAIDLAEDNIRVNAVCPSPIDTPMVRGMEMRIKKYNPSFSADTELTNGIPMKRLGKAEEVAAVIAFLASDNASFITGAGVPVDGGFLAI